MRAKDLHFILDLDGLTASHVSVLLSHTLRVSTLGIPVGGIGGVLREGFDPPTLRFEGGLQKTSNILD